MQDSDDSLQRMVAEFLRMHSKFVERFPAVAPQVDGGDLDLALLKVAAAAQMEGAALKTVDTNVGNSEAALHDRTPGEKAKEAPGEKAVGNKGAEKRVREEGVKEEAASLEQSEQFMPVSKTVYNRLPRNLKIRAGKFAEINQFYESVWTAMKECGGGPMKEKMLVQKVGEKDASRLEVLRGLAVLRSGRDGWILVEKAPSSRKVRR